MQSKVGPEELGGKSYLSIGGSFSTYNVDWGGSRMEGGTLWSDWQPNFMMPALRGLGIETEARDLSVGGSAAQPSNYRLDTYGGGLIYAWDHFQRIRPYGKFIVSEGSVDWNNPDIQYRHETRAVYAPGLGFETRAYRHLWMRADYEYQFWPDIHSGPQGDTINPEGFSIGVSYHIEHQPPVR
jgi:hypothetical protein